MRWRCAKPARGRAVTRIEAAYFATGIPFSASAMSGGTRASAMATMLDPSYAFRAGRLVSERAARHVRRFEVELGKRAPAVSVGGTEQFALPRLDPGVRDVEVYLGWLGPASRAAQALSVASSPIMRVPAVKRTLEGLLTRTVKGSTGGPDAAARERTGSVVLGAAYDAAGAKLATVRLEGVGPYDFTGPILAWGAQAAAAGKLSGVGALGPVDGFGLQMLQDGVAGAGIRQV